MSDLYKNRIDALRLPFEVDEAINEHLKGFSCEETKVDEPSVQRKWRIFNKDADGTLEICLSDNFNDADKMPLLFCDLQVGTYSVVSEIANDEPSLINYLSNTVVELFAEMAPNH